MDKTHIVLHPLAFLKIGETESPKSFQRTEFWELSEVPLIAGWPKCLRIRDTNSEGVMPPLVCNLIEANKVLVRSKRTSASATCSLGLFTRKQYRRN